MKKTLAITYPPEEIELCNLHLKMEQLITLMDNRYQWNLKLKAFCNLSKFELIIFELILLSSKKNDDTRNWRNPQNLKQKVPQCFMRLVGDFNSEHLKRTSWILTPMYILENGQRHNFPRSTVMNVNYKCVGLADEFLHYLEQKKRKFVPWLWRW